MMATVLIVIFGYVLFLLLLRLLEKDESPPPYLLFNKRTSPVVSEGPLESNALFSLGGASGSKEHPSPFPRRELDNVSPSLLVEGSDNGVLCLSDYDSAAETAAVYLWNPALPNHLRKLPPHPDDRSPSFRCGLVHNPSDGDLIVVRLSRPNHDGDGDECPKLNYHPFQNLFTRGTRATVYSLRSNSWREIPFPPLLHRTELEKAFPGHRCSVVVDHRLHWGFTYFTISDPRGFPADVSFEVHFGIAAFDPAAESFALMKPPLGRYHVRPYTVRHVCKLSGRLSLVCFSPERDFSSCEVWVMKEYGVSRSWTRHFACGRLAVPRALRPYYDRETVAIAVGTTSCGYVLFSRFAEAGRGGLFWYNIDTRVFEHYCDDARVGAFVTEYVPTSYSLWE